MWYQQGFIDGAWTAAQHRQKLPRAALLAQSPADDSIVILPRRGSMISAVATSTLLREQDMFSVPIFDRDILASMFSRL